MRAELVARNWRYARGRAYVESYGAAPVIVYEPEGERHGNFFDAAYAAMRSRPEWMRRFDKVHTQGARSLPRPALEPSRRWRELDSSMSSDALLMNIFCTPGVVESAALQGVLGVEAGAQPEFGWKAKAPLANGRFDRTEVDMRLGSLLVEAKLTESDFQRRSPAIVEAYRDFDAVFERDLLPRTAIPTARPRRASEFPEDNSQEFESLIVEADLFPALNPLAEDPIVNAPTEPGYESYQLMRNVLAAQATGSSFCVIHDERRPDLREAWFDVMAAVKSAELRVRLKVLTWQELAAYLPGGLQEFLNVKYGIVAPGGSAKPVEEVADPD
ncbi:MAG: PGN_0703 family putative restriction endonuclease [Terracidiphilus sp.]